MSWTGPHQIVTAVSRYVYETIPMLPNVGNRRPKRVHVVRLRRFANGPLGSAADHAAIERSARQDYPDNIPKRLLRYEVDRGTGAMKICVRCLGFDTASDTAEPIHTLVEDVPEMVEAFLRRHAADAVCRRMLRNYFPGGRA